MSGGPLRKHLSERQRGVATWLAWAATHVASIELALRLTLGETGLAFMWPACGVATLWILTSDTALGRLSAACGVAVITSLVAIEQGFGATSVVSLAGANIVQAVVAAWLLAWTIPGLWGTGGTATFDRTPQLTWGVSIAVVSSALAAVIAVPGLMAADLRVSVESVLLNGARNSVGFLTIAVAGHLVAKSVVCDRRVLAPQDRAPVFFVVLLVNVVVAVGTFHLTDLPVAYVVLLPSLWAGLRLRPPATVVVTVTVASLSTLGTLLGSGPFSNVENEAIQLLLQQLTTVTVMLAGLVVSAAREDLLGLLGDIDNARREAELSTALMATTLGVSRAGVVVLDPQGQPTRANAEAMRLTRQAPLDLDPIGEWTELWTSLAALTEAHTARVRVGDPHDPHVVELQCAPVSGGRGTVVHLIDITNDERARADLREFARQAAHDLRSPLAAATGWLDLLRHELPEESDVTETQRGYINRATDILHRAAEGLGELVEQAAAPEPSYEPLEVDTAIVVADAAAQLDGRARVTIDDLPAVWADPVLLGRVVLNLLTNAVKYTPADRRPQIDVAGRVTEDEVELTITDNGEGIAVSDRERIFEVGQRASTRVHGSGLGLAMCRRIIAQYDGRIWVEANPDGPGARFVIRLPGGPGVPGALDPRRYEVEGSLWAVGDS